MKKVLTILILICMTTVLYSQSVLPQLEGVQLTEFQKLCYDNVTEGCQKTQIRIVDNNLSCPVFIDENGWMFFISIVDSCLQYITIDKI